MDRNTAVMTWREVCGSDAVMASMPPTGRMLEEFARRIEAEERQRLQADADEWGNALNAAGWAVTEAYRKYTGTVEPAVFFNHAKGILRDGIAAYFAALERPNV